MLIQLSEERDRFWVVCWYPPFQGVLAPDDVWLDECNVPPDHECLRVGFEAWLFTLEERAIKALAATSIMHTHVMEELEQANGNLEQVKRIQ